MVLNPSYWLPGVLIIQILYLDLFLDLFWTIFGLRRPKNVQNVFFKNVDFLLLFHSNVMRSFKVYNWCIGLFNHSLWLLGLFRNHILYLDLFLDLFLGHFLAQKAKKRVIFFSNLDFLLPLVSIRIRITDVLACLTLPTDSFWYSKFKYHIWIYSWDNFGSLLATFGLRRTKNGITNNFKTVESLCSTYLSHNIKDPSLLILWQIYNVF